MIYKKAYAKINIGLDILGRRPDGYHQLDTIMQNVSLHDEITLSKKNQGIHCTTNREDIPGDQNNLAVQAAMLFFRKTGITRGVTLELIKKIPAQAGLGGGSTDAAAVLNGLDELYETELSVEEKKQMAQEIGSDVAFFIQGATQRATGRGEILKTLTPMEKLPILILVPHETVSTPWAFSLYHPDKIHQRPSMMVLEENLEKRQYNHLHHHMINVFEELIFPHKPMIQQAKYDMMETNPLACGMTGSGSSVFALYETTQQAEKAMEQLQKNHPTLYITHT